MKNLLDFMVALKDNGNFVTLVAVICAALTVGFITASIQRSIRRAQKLAAEERLEQKRIDAARAIVPVEKRKSMEDY